MLVVESYPRWEYRYLRNALSRDPGVEVSCLLFHPGLSKAGGGNKDYIKQFPAGLDELSKFDVVFLGDVGVDDGQLTAEQCRLLKGLVEHQASGLVFMPGMQGRQFSLLDTELGDLCPVVLDPAQPGGWGSRTPNHFELTELGPAQPAHQAGRHAGRQRRGLGGAARLPVVRAGAPGQGRQRRALPSTRTSPTSSAGCPCWSPAPSAPARCCSWGPTAPGGGARGSRTSTTIASGARSCAGWPTSGTWPRARRCGCTTCPTSRRMNQTLVAARQRDGPERRAAPRRRRLGADHGPVGQGRARAVHLGRRRVGRVHRPVHRRRSRASTRSTLSCKQTGATLEASFFVQGVAAERVGPAGAAGGAGGDRPGDARQGRRARQARRGRPVAGRAARPAAVGPPRAALVPPGRRRPAMVVLLGRFLGGPEGRSVLV